MTEHCPSKREEEEEDRDGKWKHVERKDAAGHFLSLHEEEKLDHIACRTESEDHARRTVSIF